MDSDCEEVDGSDEGGYLIRIKPPKLEDVMARTVPRTTISGRELTAREIRFWMKNHLKDIRDAQQAKDRDATKHLKQRLAEQRYADRHRDVRNSQQVVRQRE